MKIKDLDKVDRPREKLEKYGTEKLTNPELLAVLLGSGIKGLNVTDSYLSEIFRCVNLSTK